MIKFPKPPEKAVADGWMEHRDRSFSINIVVGNMCNWVFGGQKMNVSVHSPELPTSGATDVRGYRRP